jgi:hypothetical protein
MLNRRLEPRMLCADIVDFQWRDQAGRSRRGVASLEDISRSGACLQVKVPVPLNCSVRIFYPNGQLTGCVRHCVFREIGYFLGIEFDPGSQWSPRVFRPQNLLDPRLLKKPGQTEQARKVSGLR